MKKIIFALLLFPVSAGYAQTLDEQFNELKENSESFKQFKVIDQQELNKFWTVTQDSINNLKERLNTIKATSEAKEATINDLKQNLKNKEERIAELETQTSTIEVFGANINKSTFIFITFFTIGALIIVLLFVLYQFKDNRRLARAKVKDYESLNEQFEEYKKDALEKQMKLRRELQTERNKLEESRNKK